MTSRDPTAVLVIGAGIAGPVLAILLKERGYSPIIFEAHTSATDAGLSLLLQPNGHKVLSLIPGLVDRIPGINERGVCVNSLLQKKTIVFHDVFAKGNYNVRGLPRTQFHQVLVDVAQEKDIPIRWGYKLISYEQSDFEVTAIFENGEKAVGSFAVGCDGLHSGSRTALFGRENPDYLGMTQMGGLSPVPKALKNDGPRVYQFFAEGAHMVCYYCAENKVSWVVTRREEESRESWRSLDAAAVEAFRNSDLAQWPMCAGELIRTASKYVKYGLYDRPALSSWHKGRVVLLGDAAHPTSPHLGQGANQAFEDIYHLLRQFKLHNVISKKPISTSTLEHAFQDYEKVRIPRSTSLVEDARREGDKVRVVYGADACKARDEKMASLHGEEATLLRMQSYVSQPFEGVSEI